VLLRGRPAGAADEVPSLVRRAGLGVLGARLQRRNPGNLVIRDAIVLIPMFQISRPESSDESTDWIPVLMATSRPVDATSAHKLALPHCLLNAAIASGSPNDQTQPALLPPPVRIAQPYRSAAARSARAEAGQRPLQIRSRIRISSCNAVDALFQSFFCKAAANIETRRHISVHSRQVLPAR
jgi:hypothetical protein